MLRRSVSPLTISAIQHHRHSARCTGERDRPSGLAFPIVLKEILSQNFRCICFSQPDVLVASRSKGARACSKTNGFSVHMVLAFTAAQGLSRLSFLGHDRAVAANSKRCGNCTMSCRPSGKTLGYKHMYIYINRYVYTYIL